MRSAIDTYRAFSSGVVVGLAAAGVTFLAVEAARRARRARLYEADRPVVIDGVHAPQSAELNARPAEEGNAATRRLESEAPDIQPFSQRW